MFKNGQQVRVNCAEARLHGVVGRINTCLAQIGSDYAYFVVFEIKDLPLSFLPYVRGNSYIQSFYGKYLEPIHTMSVTSHLPDWF